MGFVADQTRVIRSDDEQRDALLNAGWKIVARSWGAQLNADDTHTGQLDALIARVAETVTVRELVNADRAAMLALDASTASDYPGGIATEHPPLTDESATLHRRRRAFGAWSPDGELVAMTVVDVDGDRAETDFTVVARPSRGLGVGAGVKAASVKELLSDGVRVFRTGGSAENAGSLATNTSVGYRIDEEWLTLRLWSNVPFAGPPIDTAQRDGLRGVGLAVHPKGITPLSSPGAGYLPHPQGPPQ